MNPKYEIHEWIDRYLNGEMNAPEKLEFEEQLRSDSDLSHTFSAQKIAHQMVIADQLLQLKKQMSKDLSGHGGAGGIGKWKPYLIAGTVLMTAAILVYWFMKNEPTGTDKPTETTIQEKNQSSSHSVESELETLEEKIETAHLKKQSIAVLPDKNIPSEKGESKAAKNKVNICSDSLISFSCQARGTCLQKKEGAIEIDINTIKSIKSPLLFSVKPENGFQETPVISDLQPGTYTIYVKDVQQCLHELNVKVEVQEINCGNNLKLK